MGCGNSHPQTEGEMTRNAEKTMRAALLIQMWYRRYRARLEARRRYTWSIFQSLEYAGEQDQLRLYNFFNEMMTQLQITSEKGDTKPNSVLAILSVPPRSGSGMESQQAEDEELLKKTNPDNIKISTTYKGPRLNFPLTTNQIECLIHAFKRKQILHARYLLELLHETRKALKRMPTVSYVSTKMGNQVTICGDLHGKLDDLLIILYKNGMPTASNPYIFNGDFVDRGPHSTEVAIILFAFLLLDPSSCYVNRGNHEDHVMNLRYGFIKEIMMKYKQYATKILRLFSDVFSWLPLAAVVDDKVMVCHGGVSDQTDLNFLNGIDRHRYLSALRPPLQEGSEDGSHDLIMDEKADFDEWRQVLDILWSDPKPQYGCHPNTFRGGGCYFGPDVTEKVLKRNKMQLLIRSHECKPEGYEFDHNNKVLTIFSASNYYEIGSNKGAYIKMGPDLTPRMVQYMATKQNNRKLTIKQRVSYVEDSALRALQQKICANKSRLLQAFQVYDPSNTGKIKVPDWCTAMATVFPMDLPWRSLRSKLVRGADNNDNGFVDYTSTFEEFKLETRYDQDASLVSEALYRNRDSLETIFRAIDADNSGYISMEEFEEACLLLSRHTNSTISNMDITNMARNMDMNHDGRIDFNEFLEAFRLVDQFGHDLIRRQSADSVAEGSPGGMPDAMTWSP